MKELEDAFSENDKYLIREYKKHGVDDFYMVEIGDKGYVVPYRYTIGSNTPKTSQKRFLAALTDFEGIEAGKYRRNNKKVRTISFDGEDYVVPFDSDGNVSAEELVKKYREKADAKYHAAINAVRELEELGKAPEMADFSTHAINVYANRLAEMGTTIVLDEKTPERLDILKFLQNTGEKTLNKFKTSTTKIFQDVGKNLIKAEYLAAKKYVPDGYKVAALAGVIGAGVIGGALYENRRVSDNEIVVNIAKREMPEKSTHYTDFMGREHSDKYGNIQRIQYLMPEITAALIAVEGFAENTFSDGGGVPTIGSGLTFYLDENGVETKVKWGENISADKNAENKKRFIFKHMIDIMGDNFGRKCSDNENIGGIVTGFCWGQNGFRKSEFLKSMKNNEDLDLQLRKLTGFRKQKGLMKRGFLVACLLSGKWSARDLLDLPVYEIPGKGFVNCSIYTLELRDILPCRTDANGNYLKDKQGNDIPKVGKDNFALGFYTEKAQEIKERLIFEAETGDTPYKTVRELMPENMLQMLEPEKYQGNSVEENNNRKTFYADAKMFDKGRG